MHKKNTYLRIASVLLVLALFAGCILSGTTTLAKYTAAASGDALANVAKWSILVKETVPKFTDIPADGSTVLWTVGGTCGGAVGSLLLATQPTCDAGPCTHTFTRNTELNPYITTPARWREIATARKEVVDINLLDMIYCTGTTDSVDPSTLAVAAAGDAFETHVNPLLVAPGTWGNFGDIAAKNNSDVVADIYVVIDLAFALDAAFVGDAEYLWTPEEFVGVGSGLFNPYYRLFGATCTDAASTATAVKAALLARMKFFNDSSKLEAALDGDPNYIGGDPAATDSIALPGDTITILYKDVQPGEVTTDLAPYSINGVALTGTQDGLYWMWSYEDDTSDDPADLFGFIAAGILNNQYDTGFFNDTKIGIAARLLGANKMLTAKASVFAVQVN